MRRWITFGWAAAVATVALQSASAEPTLETPRIALWDRAGAWKTATTATLHDFGFAFGDVELQQDGYVVSGTFPGGTLAGIAPDGGDVFAGIYHFTDGYVPDAKFVVHVSDKKAYAVFKGKVQYPVGKGKVRWYPFVGTYASDPATERGRPRLDMILKAVKPQHKLTAKNAKPFEDAVHRSDLPIKVAFTVGIAVRGSQLGASMLPDGAADLVLTIGPNVGSTLPFSWNNQRATSTGGYQAVGEAWQKTVRLGALGTEEDRVFFAIEADLAPEFVGTSLHVKVQIVPRNPALLQIELVESVKTEIDVPIVAQPL